MAYATLVEMVKALGASSAVARVAPVTLAGCIAEISRAHNDANVLVLGAKVIDADRARELVAVWLDTAFKGGRHQRRLEQIAALERGEWLT